MLHTLDEFDRRILDRLQRDADISTERLGEDIGLSASSVQRRIRVLRDSGVIRGHCAVLAESKLTHSTRIIAFVEMNRESPGDRRALHQWCQQTVEVQQAYYVTGSFDLVLILLTRSVQHYDEIMTGLQEQLSFVRKVTTNVSLQTMKCSLNVPIDL